MKITPGNSLNVELWASDETQSLALLSFLTETVLRPKLIISSSPIYIPISAQEEILLHHSDGQTIGQWSCNQGSQIFLRVISYL